MDGTAPGILRMNAVLDYIEDHLTEDISVSALAALSGLSDYEFRRIFSFLVGTPLSEYIRRRRMSRSAAELKGGGVSISEVGARYGYDSPSSFTRAFREVFGISPREAAADDAILSAYTRPGFRVERQGGSAIPYTLRRMPEVRLAGVSARSPITDTLCCESVWEAFEAAGGAARFPARSALYAVYENGERDVLCTVGGVLPDGETPPPGMAAYRIPAALFAAFPVPPGADERAVNDLYSRILYEFLPCSGYTRAPDVPNVEVFPDADDGRFEIRIPLRDVRR